MKKYPQDAIDDFSKSLELSSKYDEVYLYIAIAYAMQKLPVEKIVSSLRTAINLNEDNKSEAQKHSAFIPYHSDPTFCALVGLPIPALTP